MKSRREDLEPRLGGGKGQGSVLQSAARILKVTPGGQSRSPETCEH